MRFENGSRRAFGGSLLTLVVAAGLLNPGAAHAIAGGTPVAAGAVPFVAKVDTGGISCTGSLVARQWVLTAKSCFAVDGTTAPGAPGRPSSVIVGRADLTTDAGHEVAVTELVPHADRNLVLARLATPIVDVAPVPIAATAPAAGDVYRVAGYGRTATEWVPDQLQSASFQVTAVSAAAVEVRGADSTGASVCKGDSGGPALRQAGNVVELVAVSSSSWQRGCLGSSETRDGAVGVRVDDVRDWISSTVRETPPRDFNGDGKADIAGLSGNHDMELFAGDGTGKLRFAGLMWPGGGQWNGFSAVTAADFNGDGKADIAGLSGNHDMELFAGDGTGKLRFAGLMWPGGGQWNGFSAVTAGDFNGDGKADIAGLSANHDMELFAGDGTGKLRFAGLMWPGGGQWNGFSAVTAGDFNGDGKADIAGLSANHDMELFAGDGTGKLRFAGLMWPGGGQWNGFSAVTAADFNGDGKADIAGLSANHDMELFAGDGTGKLRFAGLMWPGGGQWAGFSEIA